MKDLRIYDLLKKYGFVAEKNFKYENYIFEKKFTLYTENYKYLFEIVFEFSELNLNLNLNFNFFHCEEQFLDRVITHFDANNEGDLREFKIVFLKYYNKYFNSNRLEGKVSEKIGDKLIEFYEKNY